MARIAERFPFLFIGAPPVRDPARTPSPAAETADEVGERLLGFLSALTLACFFHRIGHSEAIRRTVRKTLRNNAGESARRLLEAMFEQEGDAVLDLFLPGPARAREGPAGSREWMAVLRDGEPGTIAQHLAGQFRAEIAGLSAAGDGGTPGTGDLAFDPVRSHAIEVRLPGSLRVPLFPFVGSGTDGRSYLFRGFDGNGAEYSPLGGGPRRPSRDPAMRKCLAEYFLQMAEYPESRRIFDGLRGGPFPGDHRGLWAAVYGSLGDRFFRQGRYADAARILERSLLHRPNIPAARLQLAAAYHHLGREREAEQALEAILDRYPRMEQARIERERFRTESGSTAEIASAGSGGRPEPNPAPPRREPALRGGRQRLAEFLVDLAAAGETRDSGPLVGREREMAEILQVLCCRDKRNPLLVGDAGVGKTALVEELARRIAAGSLPEPLRAKRILALNHASLVAGAKYRGEFEERVLDILSEVRRDDSILFLDHIHTLIQPAAARGGALDAGGLLKGPLIRGEIQVIATTTYEDQQNTLDKDPALSRCFQRIPIEEPPVEEARRILAGSKARYEEFHGVGFDAEALDGSLEAIQRLLPEGKLPDKALDVVDRAAARVVLAVAAGRRTDRSVGERDLLATVAEMARIPSSQASTGFRQSLLGLEEFLGGRVIGQGEAIGTVSRVLRSAARGLKLQPDRPNGVFLFLGPTGVGKTELARAMAEALFGGTDGLIRIDMSEYMDRISTSRLIGAAPGYVGYNDLNQLTDKVRRRPHCLILLDEVEKADPQAMQLFLQVFDAGRLTDGRGRTVSFGAATIVMTTNLGSDLYARTAVGYSRTGTPGKASRETLRKELMNRFPPEFLNRIDEFVFFRRLRQEDVRAIADLQLRVVRAELDRQGKRLEVGEQALEWLARKGFSPIWGARDLGRCIRREVLDPLAQISLGPEWNRVERIRVDLRSDRLRFACDPAGESVSDQEVPPAPPA